MSLYASCDQSDLQANDSKHLCGLYTSSHSHRILKRLYTGSDDSPILIIVTGQRRDKILFSSGNATCSDHTCLQREDGLGCYRYFIVEVILISKWPRLVSSWTSWGYGVSIFVYKSACVFKYQENSQYRLLLVSCANRRVNKGVYYEMEKN